MWECINGLLCLESHKSRRAPLRLVIHDAYWKELACRFYEVGCSVAYAKYGKADVDLQTRMGAVLI